MRTDPEATERKQAEQELAESEARYRALAESSPLAVLVCRNHKDDDTVVLVNPACVKLFGTSSPDQLIGRSALDLFDPDSRSLVRGPIHEATAEIVRSIEAQIVRLDGTPVDVDITAAPLLDQGMAATQVVLRDITELKKAHEGAVRLAAIVTSSPDAIITKGLDEVIMSWNPAAEALGGYTAEEIIGRGMDVLMPPGLEDEPKRLTEQILKGEKVERFETQRKRKDGSLVDVAVTLFPILDRAGDIVVITVMAQDITERKQAEQDRLRAEKFFRDTFEHADVGIAHVGLNGAWLRVNQRLCDMLGYSREELLAATFAVLTHPDDVEENRAAFRRMAAGEQSSYVADKRSLRKDGSYTWAHLNATMIYKEDGAPDYVLVVISDITERRRAEELAARQAEHIERTLTSVIDIAGNIGEMRDPYTAGHQKRVTELASRIAQDLGMSDPEIADIRVAGLLHDMGKVGVPTEILSKPGTLSPTEFELIKGHAEAGYQLAISANMAEPIPELIYQHHERCDGSGYPRGLMGDQMLPGAKVLAVADVVEAIMSHRPYRPALGIEAALAEIERGAGSLYDADASRVCVSLFRDGGFEFSS